MSPFWETFTHSLLYYMNQRCYHCKLMVLSTNKLKDLGVLSPIWPSKATNNELVQGGMHIPTVQGIFIGSFTQSPKPTKVPTTRKGKTTEHDDVLTLK